MTTLFAIPAEGISESTSSGIAIPLPPQPGVMKFGSVADPSESDYKRNNFFRPTGTYYDKALTDIVYCYDVLWEPDYAVGAPKNATGWDRTERARFTIAGDRRLTFCGFLSSTPSSPSSTSTPDSRVGPRMRLRASSVRSRTSSSSPRPTG